MQNLKLLLLIALLFSTLPAMAQRKAKKKKEKEKTETIAEAPKWDESEFKALKWRNIGPFRGGRSNAVSGVVGNDQLYYTGYTGGGLWKTENAGQSWQNISDGHFKSSSVGDIAVSEADPNVIYVGMGEHAVRGVMTTFGDGVYKSTDAGDSWTHLGLEKTRHISDVIIHPSDPDVVYVAAQGALHGSCKNRGIYKSTDGGKNWKKVLYVDENTGASSLSMDMTNPRILYAATWEHRRLPWQVRSGGPGSAIWKSTDGGESWKKINSGLPEMMGKIGVAVSRANPDRVFAIVEAEKAKAGLYRSDNGGKSWTLTCNDQLINARSWYYMEVFPDPQNQEIVYVLNAPATRSIDGGKTFNAMRVGHGDTHDLWINPDNTANMILGDDGGGEITFNSGKSWSTLYNQPTAQFYRVNADKQFPYWVYGGQQDNSSVAIASRTNGAGITEKDWFAGPGCESAYIAFDPSNPEKLYGGCYQGLISVLDTRTLESKDIMQYPSLKLANEPKDMKYRYNWNAPIFTSPHDPNTIYHAGNVLFKTIDGGMNWDAISPDLTRNDTTKQGLGGAPFTNEGAGGENYNTIYYALESTLEEGVLYTGSDCGLVHVSRNGGDDWENITPEGLEECTIHSMEASPHDKGTIYVAANRYKFNDFRAMAYKSTDYGKTWKPINKGIQVDDYLRVIREDPKTPGLLYGGGERAFYISFNGGDEWQPCQLNLPVVPVTDLIIRDNDLVAATQGRAFWILDDLGPLQQTKGEFGDAMVQLLQPKPTVRFGSGRRTRTSTYGQNPPTGVILNYYLSEKADDEYEAKLEILDSAGEVLRTYSSKKKKKEEPAGFFGPRHQTIPANKGLNRFAWDFRVEAVQEISDGFVFGDSRGYRVAPGNYRARLSFKDQVSETEIEILQDPRLEVTKEDWMTQQSLLKKVTGHITDIHESIIALRKVKKQLKVYNEILEDVEEEKELKEKGEKLIKQIDEWQNKVIQTKQKNTQDVINFPSKLNVEFFTIKGKLDSYDPRVTGGVKTRLSDLETEWAKHKESVEDLKKVINDYSREFKSSKAPALSVPVGERE